MSKTTTYTCNFCKLSTPTASHFYQNVRVNVTLGGSTSFYPVTQDDQHMCYHCASKLVRHITDAVNEFKSRFPL